MKIKTIAFLFLLAISISEAVVSFAQPSEKLLPENFFRSGSANSPSAVTLSSSNPPIVGIYTYYTPIPDEPKIKAFMAMIDHGYNVINHVSDTTYTYYGYIGIEKRGSISQLWPQPSYSMKTTDSLLNGIKVPLMGIPKESDWVLYGVYNDYALMRNVLTYQLAR